MGKCVGSRRLLSFVTMLWLATSCATNISTTVKKDPELARIKSFGVIDVAELRGGDIVSKALVSGLRQKGFVAEKAQTAEEDSIRNAARGLNVDGVIYGYISRTEQHSWVTQGEERVRTRETATGTKETVTYEPPRLIINKTINVRIRALDSVTGDLLWDAEAEITDDIGADDAYMVEKLVGKILEELPHSSTKGALVPQTQENQSVLVGQHAPDFVANTIKGEKIALADFVGKKTIVLNFWGIRCLPCIQEMPKLESIYGRYKDKGLEILAVNVDGVDSEVMQANLVKQLGGTSLSVTYPLLLDEEFKIIDLYHLTVAPLTVLIDRGGVIRYRHTDYQPGDEVDLENAIKQVLQSG
ncbi:redoxin domain-containing protein [Candidatus Poribacteria bacterium]|nr:redoxin domain-containing protein [Candidatus Poribacteria bacterium]